ncbi:MAG: hypothetical protein L0H84_09305 [Pseudonocardia sp.]|nr:hypothetical protein [Pseudonocardia sp.]
MGDAEPASAAALAGLASEVEALRRVVDPLPGRLSDLARVAADLTAQVRDLATAPKPGAVPTWLVAPTDVETVGTMLGELHVWIATVFLRYRDGAIVLPECWSWHPDVVEELLWLMHAWLAAYQGEKASIALVGDWHDRYRPGVVRRIKGYAQACSLEVHLDRPDRRRDTYAPRRPDTTELISAWWVGDRTSRGPKPTAEHLVKTGGSA